MVNPARVAALQALLLVEENEGYSNIVLDRVLRERKLPRRDGALASAVFYGVLEKRLTLDWYIFQCLREPKKKPERLALEALRCGTYQILFLDRVPDSAAVNETVEALKELGGSRATGFVNGVLRGLLRKRESLALPAGDSPRAWAVRYSVPEPLIRLWMGAYGREVTQKLLEAFEKKAGLYVQVNSLRTEGEALQAELEKEGVSCSLLSDPPGAAVLENCGAPMALAAFAGGKFHVQDLSAQWVCRLLDARPGETVCDCCAAPGGKSFTIAQHMEDTGKVYALDLYKGRVGLIRQGAQRLGLANVESGMHDACKGFDDFPLFDRVLCDVPCSGFGVIRRKPEIRYKNLSTLKKLPALQLSILEKAAEHVKPGGRVVYSTCTLNPAENSEVAGQFLRSHPEFAPVPFTLPGLKRLPGEPEHMLTLLPFAGGSDGFFAAVFERKG